MFLLIKPLFASSSAAASARLIRAKPIPYPDYSREIGEEGTTWVKVLVKKTGKAAALSLTPNDPVILLSMAHEYAQPKQFAKAVPLYQKITSQNPSDGQAYEDLGDAYYREEDWMHAMDAWTSAVDIFKRRNNTVKVKKIQENLKVLEERMY